MVELALAIPLLTILLLTLADLGLLIREHQIIQTAVREGARFSALSENRLGLAHDPARTCIASARSAFKPHDRPECLRP